MKKRVLFVVSTPLKNAGVPNVVMQIARALKNNFQFDALVCGDDAGDFDEEFCALGGEIFRCPMPIYQKKRITYIKKWKYLYRFVDAILQKSKYDIVHCNNGLESSAVLKRAAKKNIPIRISHAHGYYPNKGKNPIGRLYQYICKQLICKYATNKLACSQKAGDSLFSGQAYQNILNPINLSQYNFEKKSHTGIHLLQIGYFCNLKNQLFSLAILKELVQQGIDARLSLIGFELEEGYLAKMQRYIRENKLQDRVHILASDYSKKEIFSTTDFLLLPSTSEGLPLVALEGQASRSLCLLSDVITKEVDVGMAIYLPINDPKQWAVVISGIPYKEYHRDDQKLSAFDLTRYIEAICWVYNGKEVESYQR